MKVARLQREFSEYPKRIATIVRRVHCVAKAEKMFRETGMALLPTSEIAEKIKEHKAKKGNSTRSRCRKYYL